MAYLEIWVNQVCTDLVGTICCAGGGEESFQTAHLALTELSHGQNAEAFVLVM